MKETEEKSLNIFCWCDRWENIPPPILSCRWMDGWIDRLMNK